MTPSRALQAQSMVAYDEYDRALHPPSLPGGAPGGGWEGVPLPGGGGGGEGAAKGKGPRFPIKFKLKVPGQDFASHLKFLQVARVSDLGFRVKGVGRCG